MAKEKLSVAQKEAVIEAVREHGTYKRAAEETGVALIEIKAEIKRSAVFKKRLAQAKEEGKSNLAEKAIEVIKGTAFAPEDARTDRNKLLAAITLANAYEPGFKGTTTVQGKMEHEIKVLSAVPRPVYDLPPGNVKALPSPKPKSHKGTGKKRGGAVLLAPDGEIIGIQAKEKAKSESV